jgi:hypothetical protein
MGAMIEGQRKSASSTTLRKYAFQIFDSVMMKAVRVNITDFWQQPNIVKL